MAGFVDRLTFDQFATMAPGLVPKLDTGKAIATSGKTLSPALAKVVSTIMLGDVRNRFMTGTAPDGTPWRPLRFARPNGGDQPLRDTGVLMASLHAGFDSRSAWVATTHPGAAVQNFGATIRARGKMLAIPLTREAKRSGGPRRWKGPALRFQPTRKRRVFLLTANGAGQFLLVDQVTVPQRRFMGLSAQGEDQVCRAILEGYSRGWIAR